MADIEHPTSAGHHEALTGDLSEAARVLFSAGTVRETLQSVVDLSVATIEGCDFAGLFVVEESEVTTPVCTDPIVIEIDMLQHRSGEGPCLDVINGGGSLYAEDLGEDNHWPTFSAGAVSIGIRSAVAFGFAADGVRGALNLYARYPHAFGVIDRANGQILATLSGIALSAAEAHENAERREQNSQHALVSREMIGQAMGILMERERISADAAFDILRRASQRLNVKLRDVAQNLIETGEKPASRPAPQA